MNNVWDLPGESGKQKTFIAVPQRWKGTSTSLCLLSCSTKTKNSFLVFVLIWDCHILNLSGFFFHDAGEKKDDYYIYEMVQSYQLMVHLSLSSVFHILSGPLSGLKCSSPGTSFHAAVSLQCVLEKTRKPLWLKWLQISRAMQCGRGVTRRLF